MILVTLRRWINLIFIVTGVGLTLYVAIAVLGFVRNSSAHYTSFVLVTLIMAALLSFQKLLDGKIHGPGTRFWGLQVLIAVVAAALAIGGAAYLRIHAVRLETIQPFFEDFDIWIGLLLLVGLMLLNGFHWGWLLTSMIIVTILYFFFGHLIPNPLLAHPDYDVSFVMHYMGLGITDGIFWFAMLAVDSIYFLLIYAAVLLGVGMLKMVIEIGKATGRRLPGGAAFPAIIGSGIVASVMGQAVTNVMLTGRLTIPMMKSHGYRKEMAGAVEAVASCSGQIMPPVLGLAGFLIAQFLNIPYIDVALAALIPALLFLAGVGIAVVVSAYRERLPKLHEPVDFDVIKRLLPPFLVSFGTVLILLLGYYSPAIAGLAGVILALLLAPLQGKYRPKLKELYVAFEDGLVIVTVLSLLLIAVGPLAQTFLTTNLVGRIATYVSTIAPDITLLLLFGAMIVALVFGMGLPTPVAYLVVAIMLVPFLQQLGVPALHAHFFVFYFAVFSSLSPPVAVGPLAASKLSGGSFLGTALDALKIASTTFVIPFGFVYHPELLSFPNVTWSVIPPLVLVLSIQWTTSVCCYGYFLRDLYAYERGMFGIVTIGGLVVVVNEGTAQLLVFIGLLVASAAWVYRTRNSRAPSRAVEPSPE